MKVVLFCGGLGLRLRSEAETTPKPMVTIGGRPILWHVMRYYAHFGHRDFIICLGYGGDAIRQFFQETGGLEGCRVTCVETGLEACVGQRLRAVRSYVQDEPAFLANYSDGLSDLDLPSYIDQFHRANKIGSFLCVRPTSSFHVVSVDSDGVVSDIRPAQQAGLWINGGFFVFKPAIFDYIGDGEDLVEAPFQRLIREGQLFAYRVKGFWACMDTFKDRQFLESLHCRGPAPWEVWRHRKIDAHPDLEHHGFALSQAGTLGSGAIPPGAARSGGDAGV